MTSVFDHDQFLDLIRKFGNEIPSALREHQATASLAERVAPIRGIADARFTLAVVGQMRSGKSSLLNSLVGEPLAVVGVNETTATINWFRHGTGALTEHFRVTWEDETTEDLQLARIDEWIGDSGHAKRTKKIEFFSESDFLQVANIVDTPGTRSVLESHEQTIQEFLADSHEETTLREGEKADAILYVIPPVAGSTDEDLLRTFEDSTRLPGSTPYNSIAVVHKWETLNAPDLCAEGRRKAEIAAKALDGLVADVVPVSAPLSWAADHFPVEYWTQIIQLVHGTPPDSLSRITKSDRHFLGRGDPDCPLSPEERKDLFRSHTLPWASFRALLQIAAAGKCEQPEALRLEIEKAGGLKDLKAVLQSRFFSRSRTIKCFSTLAKAVSPCRTAQIRLQNQKGRLLDAVGDASAAREILKDRIDRGDLDLSPALRYIHETLETTNCDLENTSATLRKIGKPLSEMLSAYESMEKDFKYLEILESDICHEIPESWRERLAILFGSDGAEVSDRMSFLALPKENESKEQQLIEIIEELRELSLRLENAAKEIVEHGIDRIDSLLDVIESEG